MAAKAKSRSKPAAASQIGVIYARYSSHNQKEESIEQQVEECSAYAAANNIRIIDVYSDKAISGKTDRRTSFQRMLRDAERQRFTVVIAYKSNRISRNMLQALTYENRLEEYGVRTLYAKEEFGNTAAGRFALRTMMNVNQFYSENMAEDIKRGLADNATNCKVNGALPFGYKKGSDGKFAIDGSKADVVREIFQRVLDGETFAAIAEDLNNRGIPTSRGNRWNKGSFHRMLVNDTYIGIYRHSGIVVDNGVPPILDKEMFFAMQDMLTAKETNKVGKQTPSDYLLTGKLYCGPCESHMVGVSGTSHTGDKHHYYVCNNRRTGGNCHKDHVRRDWIENQIAILTREHVLQPEVIEWIADNALSAQLRNRRTAELVAMEECRAEKKKAIKNLVTALEQGIFSASTRERLLELEEEVADLDRSIAIAKKISKPVERERIIYALEQLRRGNVNDKAYQAQLIDTFVKAVYLWDDRIRIDFFYTGKKDSLAWILPNKKDFDADGPRFVLTPLGSTTGEPDELCHHLPNGAGIRPGSPLITNHTPHRNGEGCLS